MTRKVSWNDPLTTLKGVGKVRSRRFREAGFATVGQLLLHFPTRYKPPAVAAEIGSLAEGMRVQIVGRVTSVNRLRDGRVVAEISDGTGEVEALWFNQPFRARQLRPNRKVLLKGEVEEYGGKLQLVHPVLQRSNKGDQRGDERPEPVYSSVAGLSPRQVQRLCQQALHALKQAPDPLPRDILDSRELPTREQALHLIHAPDSLDKVDQAQRRFRFEELFLLEVALLWARRQNRDNVEGHAHMGKGCLVEAFRQQLPFELTAAQKRVWQEIQEDMAAGHPMHRLLQGDVGSGKTVVAVMALLRAVEAGQQAALMAPTELLAEQHYQKLCTQLEPLDQDVGLLTSSVVGQHRADVLERLARGKLALVVGTHALFQEGVRFDRLSLVITDEQHRFGVRQRAELGAKGANPDILVMSATPIPRSLALTFFGDLDTSTIDELPAGRKPIRTYWRPSNRRQLVYRFVRDQLAEGRQAYIVCPLVEESEEVQARAVTRWVESVRDLLSGYEVGVMHGRLSSDKKETTMRAFRDGKLAALVCTTVIEVGIDVPNVSVMVIEDADRFGLAQLHQLRGRIGRGPHQSYCILMADSVTEAARERLALMTEHTDGFKLAEHDLRLRGPGEFLGTRQHGLPPFEHADPVRDYQLLLEARQEAQRLLTVDPNLARSAHSRLRGAVQERYSDFFDLVLSG